MEGIIVNFRRGLKRQTTNQMVIVVSKVDSKEKAKQLVGKEVLWKSPAGKELKGKVSALHGNNGAVRALFETGMPGQAIGTKVEIK